MLYTRVIITNESADEILKCDHSNESYGAVLSCGRYQAQLFPLDWPLLTFAVAAVLGSCEGSGVVLRARLTFWFSFLILIKPNVTLIASVGVVVAVVSRRTIY